jgi:hypothetical protein
VKSSRPVLQRGVTLSQANKVLQLGGGNISEIEERYSKKTRPLRHELGALERELEVEGLDIGQVATLSSAVAEYSQHNHYQQSDKDNDNRNLHQRKQETDERYQLF